MAQRIRATLPAYRGLDDREVMARPFSLGQAQELLAREHGFPSWAALVEGQALSEAERPSTSTVTAAYPQLFVADIERTVTYYRERLGFEIVFLYGEPPFYGQLERDAARLNFRVVSAPVVDHAAAERSEFLAAYLVVDGVKGLYPQFLDKAVDFYRPLKTKPWGIDGFVVRDPDGNLLTFAEPSEE